MAKNQNVFLKSMHATFISDLKGDPTKKQVRIPGEDSMSFIIPADSVYPSADQNGNAIPKHFNVKLGAPGDRLEVRMTGEDGNPVRKDLSVQAIAGAWRDNQRELAKDKGDKVYLNGVSEKMIRDSGIEIKDADGKGTGRFMKSISVADPASQPQPLRDKDGNVIEGKFRETGYGSFVVSPDAITPVKDGKPGKVNVYIGRANENVRNYQVFTGEYDEAGKGIYEKQTRTAGDVKSQYEADIASFKAKMAEKDAAEKGNDGKGADDKGLGE